MTRRTAFAAGLGAGLALVAVGVAWVAAQEASIMRAVRTDGPDWSTRDARGAVPAGLHGHLSR